MGSILPCIDYNTINFLYKPGEGLGAITNLQWGAN